MGLIAEQSYVHFAQMKPRKDLVEVLPLRHSMASVFLSVKIEKKMKIEEIYRLICTKLWDKNKQENALNRLDVILFFQFERKRKFVCFYFVFLVNIFFSCEF